LGATQGTVLRLMLKRGLTPVGIGMAIGFGAALIIGRLIARALYGISGADPLSIGGAALMLFAVAFVACYLPAVAASRVDPLTALRQE
jgi:ABC-type antimicrobial peptide transport system permease subunit